MGADGEVTVDTDSYSLVVHDGKTPGGTLIARFADLNAANVIINDLQGLTGKTTVQEKLSRSNVTFEDFGAIGDGKSDDTLALLASIRFAQSTGKPVYGSAGSNYCFHRSLPLVDSKTGAVAKLRGAGSNSCVLTPVGKFDAIMAHGRSWQDAGNGAARGVEFSGFAIDGSKLDGSILDIRRVGLHSSFEDLKLGGNKGIGIYLRSVFDHVYRNIEVRNCGGLGIFVYETTPNDAEGFQECSFLHFDRVHVLSCNVRNVQWVCSGGDAYTFIGCKPSEGSTGIRFTNRSVGHSLIGTYVDGQTVDKSKHNVGIEIGLDCFNINVVGGRFWNVRYAVDFLAGGRSSVAGTNVVYDSPTGSDVYDVRLQKGVQQAVSVAAGLAVEDASDMLRSPVRRKRGNWQPFFAADSELAGDFRYSEQSGEFRIEGELLYVSYYISWTAKPRSGRGFGLSLPYAVATGKAHQLIRTSVLYSDISLYKFLGHFQDNASVTKLYLYADARSLAPALADAFPESGTMIGNAVFPMASRD